MHNKKLVIRYLTFSIYPLRSSTNCYLLFIGPSSTDIFKGRMVVIFSDGQNKAALFLVRSRTNECNGLIYFVLHGSLSHHCLSIQSDDCTVCDVITVTLTPIRWLAGNSLV